MMLTPEWRVGSVILTDYPFLVPFGGVDYGAPENVTEIIRALLDGDIEVTSRAGNRSVSLPVLIEESDMAALADAEALLAIECDKWRNEVYCDPGDGFGLPFIFDVFKGQLTFSRSDEFEMAGYRSYSLTFRALPSSKSVDAVTITPTTSDTGREKVYTFDAPGSARVEPTVHVGGSAGLGETLIYTRPGGGGFIPLRQYKSGGGADEGDSSLVSGEYDANISTAFEATVPKFEVVDGTYVLMARLERASGSGSITIDSTVQTVVDGYGARGINAWTAPTALNDTYAIVQLGPKFQLPAAILADDTLGEYVVTIKSTGAPVAVTLDQAWLVEVEVGALTWTTSAQVVGDGITGMAQAQHFWHEPPSVERPYKRLLRGASSDQSDAFGAVATRWGAHYLTPGVNGAAIVTTGTTTSALDFTFQPRWHTHAGS